MTTLSLTGDWTLVHFSEGQYVPQCPAELHALGLEPIPAQVPGNVELDLERAGQLPEPFYAENIRGLRDLETHEWWYAYRFQGPPAQAGARWELVFEGLN